MSPLLSSLYFDRAIEHLHTQVCETNMVEVANMSIAAALYADDIALLAPQPTSLQYLVNSSSNFCTKEFLRISADKTLVLNVHCNGAVKLHGKPLIQVNEAKYLGINQHVKCSSR